MNNSEKAKNIFGDLIDEDLYKKLEENTKSDNELPDVQYIVYFKGELPDTVWEYYHNPDNGIPYGRLYGYWDEDKEEKISRHFVEHKSKNYKLMDFDTFMERVPPNKDCVKIFDSEADFLLELI